MKLRLLLGFQYCVIGPKLSGIAAGEAKLEAWGLFVCLFVGLVARVFCIRFFQLLLNMNNLSKLHFRAK